MAIADLAEPDVVTQSVKVQVLLGVPDIGSKAIGQWASGCQLAGEQTKGRDGIVLVGSDVPEGP